MINFSKVGGTSITVAKKKFQISEFQLVCEFINKVLFPRYEKRTIAYVVDQL